MVWDFVEGLGKVWNTCVSLSLYTLLLICKVVDG